ncbi:unnamed protein product [Moneuplotes crassus]|uniref:Uncharacterized protein n=1 Tax=Euplotes crassus TaxID=5936 RepID=A0AAD1Y6B5_EUPCR|nr:unnamed protein product [Moneuplotes crassus]
MELSENLASELSNPVAEDSKQDMSELVQAERQVQTLGRMLALYGNMNKKYTTRIAQIKTEIEKIKRQGDTDSWGLHESGEDGGQERINRLKMTTDEILQGLESFEGLERSEEVKLLQDEDSKKQGQDEGAQIDHELTSASKLMGHTLLEKTRNSPLCLSRAAMSELQKQANSINKFAYCRLLDNICNLNGHGHNEMEEHNELSVFLAQQRLIYFLNKTKKMLLPCLEKVYLGDITKSYRLAKHFLKNCFPLDGINWLKLSAASQIDISCYLFEIIKASYRVKSTLILTNFRMNEAQLNKLLFANKHKEKIMFEQCRLCLPEISNLGKYLEGTTIRQLYLFNCETPDYCNWIQFPDRLENLISGISRCYLRDSLREINFGWRGLLSEGWIEQTFKRYGLDHVKISGNFRLS